MYIVRDYGNYDEQTKVYGVFSTQEKAEVCLHWCEANWIDAYVEEIELDWDCEPETWDDTPIWDVRVNVKEEYVSRVNKLRNYSQKYYQIMQGLDFGEVTGECAIYLRAATKDQASKEALDYVKYKKALKTNKNI